LPIGFSEPQVSMDHRIKPGGDEEYLAKLGREKRAASAVKIY
jgi:hypothetical protein